VANFEKAPVDVQEILSKPIQQLGLKLEGSPLERFVQQLYKELDAKGFKKFRPKCYLTDEWGCPNMEPVIGIPFYLADPKLQRLESEMNDIEDARQIMMYMRHEAGHAFNYAYALYKTQECRDLFGPFRRPYRDNYKPVPFSRQFVRHMEGWYAQKHPDEDFAETFAVWLKPNSDWRKTYAAWPAFHKLNLVEELMASCRGRAAPVRNRQRVDAITSDTRTLAQVYRRKLARRRSDRRGLAQELLLKAFSVERERPLVEAVSRELGLPPYSVHQILRMLIERCERLELYVRGSRRDAERNARWILGRVARFYAQGETPHLAL
jgi:hypothetical protein